MITLLSRLFIKNRHDISDKEVRSCYGVLAGCLGIALNILLFSGKLAAGALTRSVAVAADAFNNLSDAGSSIIMLLGFRLSKKKPDSEHPFGHGRFEYISGLLVSAAIVLMGFELLMTSIRRIVSPAAVEFSLTSVIILGASVIIKLYMALYNRTLGKRLDSAALRAASLDSLSDSAATGVVLVATAFGKYFSVPLDGWCGTAVSLFVLYSGLRSARETVAPLLGQPPDPAFVQHIKQIVTSYDRIAAVHDLIIHDYGPGRRIVSLHAEVPMTAEDDVFAVHDIIDNAERRLRSELGLDATIHLDPVSVGNALSDRLKAEMTAILAAISPALEMHDFRIVPGPTHTNMIFDVVVPFDLSMTPDEVRDEIERRAAAIEGGRFYAVVTVERPFA